MMHGKNIHFTICKGEIIFKKLEREEQVWIQVKSSWELVLTFSYAPTLNKSYPGFSVRELIIYVMTRLPSVRPSLLPFHILDF